VKLDYATVESLFQNHPALRLLRSDHAPLIVSFLHRIFIKANVRFMAQADLVEALEDDLFNLRAVHGANLFPKSAVEYLNDWAENTKGWLRKFYRPDIDEPYFDLTATTEKALTCLSNLDERHFVGTESRLLTLFELLKQIEQGTEIDLEKRLAELYQRREMIDKEIAETKAGTIKLLDGTALRDRFQQFIHLSQELLSDFRAVEQNFRTLDRKVREQITLWEGSKGALLEKIMQERDIISHSDQGKNFRAFWDFLMSSANQDQLTKMLERILDLPEVIEMQPEARMRRIHYDWLEAGEQTQRTIAQLSQQLRRFLDDQSWMENRRIRDILRGIEAKALTVREQPPSGVFMTIADSAATVELPMERPLYTPTVNSEINATIQPTENAEIDAGVLFSQVVIDKSRLVHNIRQALQDRNQISLRELCTGYPLQYGLAELITYLQLAETHFKCVIEDGHHEIILWKVRGSEEQKQARLPRIIFVNGKI